MTTAAIVPMRHSSERVPGKNYRELGGMPMYRHIVNALLQVDEIDLVVIDTDSQVILDDAVEVFPTVKTLIRPEHLRAGETPMNEVLLNTIDSIEADVVLQTHSTNPFLSSGTISHALKRYFSESERYDSAFSVSRLQARLWDADTKPVNHDPSVLLRTQDLPPIYLENSCFYIFTPGVLRARSNRIGERPLMVEVPDEEALDIDVQSEWDLAEIKFEMGRQK